MFSEFIFCSHKLSLPSPSIIFFLQNLVCIALSCQLKMKSMLCLVLPLSYLAYYFASLDSLSPCPKIRLAGGGPNTAPVFYTFTQHLQNSSCMPQSTIPKLLTPALLVNVCVIYCLDSIKMQLCAEVLKAFFFFFNWFYLTLEWNC